MYLRLMAGSAAAVLLIVACADGGGGSPGGNTSAGDTGLATVSPTLGGTAGPEETYYSELASALTELSNSFKALADLRRETFDPALSEQERREGSMRFGMAYEAFAASAQTRLTTMMPPAELRSLHEALARAATDLQHLGGELRLRLETEPTSTLEEFGELFAELDGLSIEQRFWDACFDLKQAAARKGVSAAFDCGR
jgi:hypothetical protein